MGAVDEDLRHGAATAGACHHFGAFVGVGDNVDFLIADALLAEQAFGRVAIAANGRGIDFDFDHDSPELCVVPCG